MALDANTVAEAIVRLFTRRRYRRPVPFWRDVMTEIFGHLQANLELTNFPSSWDNFDKDLLNLITFTELTSRTSAQATYSVSTTSDEVVLQDTGVGAGANFTVTLPGSPYTGQRVVVKDTSGNALNRNIVIQGNGNNIDGAGSQSIGSNYGTAHLVFDGSNWFLI